jgi:hypothetical protein
MAEDTESLHVDGDPSGPVGARDERRRRAAVEERACPDRR